MLRPFRHAADARAVLNARWHLRGAELGPRVRLWGRPAVSPEGRLVVGDRAKLFSTIATLEIVVGPEGTLSIGERVLLNFGCNVVAVDRVTIGDDCLIGPHCMIMDTTFHELAPERRLEQPTPQPITLGSNVWLGARVFVMPGVTIGDDAAIGAGSIVTADVPPRTLAAGAPARVIKEL